MNSCFADACCAFFKEIFNEFESFVKLSSPSCHIWLFRYINARRVFLFLMEKCVFFYSGVDAPAWRLKIPIMEENIDNLSKIEYI